jgi:hypothetical protein
MQTSNESFNNLFDSYELVDDFNLFNIDNGYINSLNFLNQSRKANLFLTLILITIGLVGHSLTIFVFSQKRFRHNSSNIYFLCLALNDSAYLIIHLFKDTIRTYNDIYLSETEKKTKSFIQYLNLIDQYELTCRLMNYLRNVLRFTSAYIVIAFTLQRLVIVYSPFSNKFKSKKSAWKTVTIIIIISILINSWILFIFELQKGNNNYFYCNVKDGWDKIYFHLTLVYICIIMLIPILIIFTSNSFLISSIYKNKSNHLKNAQSSKKIINKNNINIMRLNNTKINNNEKIQLKPYFLTINQIINRVTNQANSTKKLTKMLILISFSYALFNLPYFITWSLFYYNETFIKLLDASEHNYYYSALKICELFFVLNYGIYFYIYILSGSVFRNQLKYSSK